jgi:hypothetical protein
MILGVNIGIIYQCKNIIYAMVDPDYAQFCRGEGKPRPSTVPPLCKNIISL